MDTLKIGIIGMGRIGKIHLDNLTTRIDGVAVDTVINPSEQGQGYALKFGVPTVSSNPDVLFGNPEIDAVLICSPSDTHAPLALRAVESGKAIFCEKPIDMSLVKAKEVVDRANAKDIPLMVAFNRRFDPDFAKVQKELRQGGIGAIHSLHIISRDPAPPPISYIKQSGGLFKDMTIHDFDMARFLMASEVTEVFATGSCMVDPAIGAAGDIDTAVVLLRFENGATALIENSRKAVYGYDQRLEVFGSKGMLQVNNPLRTNVTKTDVEGLLGDLNLDFFMDRYRESYLIEMQCFVDALRQKRTMPVGGEDGIQSIILAEAANTSLKENRPVSLR